MKIKTKTADNHVHATNEICMAFTGQPITSSVLNCIVRQQYARYQAQQFCRLQCGSITPTTVHTEKVSLKKLPLSL
jgi:hypothetical protein